MKKDSAKNEEVKWYDRFVIPPNNYWNLMWSNFMLVIFLLYCFLMPMVGSYEKYITAV